MADAQELEVINYFIDEAGGPVLFDRRGKKVLVGEVGTSKYFILGKLLVDDCDALRDSLNQLRANLLADPYFRKVESMKPERQKTAIMFHAKDDLPEVRREVFSLLLKCNVRFYAVVRNKLDLVNFVRQRQQEDAVPKYRYRENELYDTLTRHLFNKLRQTADEVNLIFASRGKSNRNAALLKALAEAEQDFEQKFGFARKHKVNIQAKLSKEDACLQASDYFLWALQRHFEMGESRFIELMWPKVGEIHDLDITQGSRRGAFYTQQNPLVPRDE
ncbi:MAG: DUF3800 domain-containing protein [Planctomycetaceae bacterium]